MEYSSFTYFDEHVHKKDSMEYSSFAYIDENVYKNDSMEYSSFTYFDEIVYKTTECNITVLYTFLNIYKKRQYGI